ncbi:MAG: 30S ribosomal protein S9 [Bacilli bacterium]|nr:30S ribosomal protein S9 [Bacilli bacterium]
MAKVYQATGKRKSSIAKVTMTNGSGKITVNGRDVREYFPFETLVMDLEQPLELTGTKELFDIDCSVKGGGFRGQSGAIRLGITKALLVYDTATKDSENSLRKPLKVNGMITRDARVKERKKYGLKKARRAPQFSKR